MINLFGEIKFKPLIRFRKVIPGYYVPEDGKGIVGKKGKYLSVWNDTKGYPTSSVTIPSDFFPDYIYKTQPDTKDSLVSLKIALHRAVMESWMPIDDNPPASLAEQWNEVITPEMVGQPRITENFKQWVRDTALVDHVDRDVTNNHRTNLKWEIPKNNESNRKNFILSNELNELLQY